ncbi:MAG: cytochrome P450 [Burkholderiaceae bacterium]
MTATVPEVDVDPFSTENLTDPHPMYEQLREAGALVRIPRYDIFAVARHAEVQAVLNDWQTYISSAGVGLANFHKETPFRPRSLILEADPPDHTRVRTVLARILSPKAMREMRTTFEAEADALLDRMMAKAADGPVDGVRDLAEPYPLKVFPDAVGLEAEGRENLLAYGDMIFNAFGPRNALLQKAAERVQPVTAWIMNHCERAALRPGGFGDQIYQAADAGEIGRDEAPMLVRSFLSAGVDTTINGLGNALYCLSRHPEQYAKLRDKPALSRQAFEEGLRFESTVQTFFRTTRCDTELAGHRIPQDNKVLAFLASANRDPRQWTAPDTFDIERRASGHTAFGSGIHSCVGQAVARLEGELVLGGLARRATRITPAGEPVRRLNNTLRALASLPLTLEAA